MDGKGQYQRVIQVQVGGAGGSQLPNSLADQTPIKVTQHAIGGGLPQIAQRRDDTAASNITSSDFHLPPIDAH